MVNQIGMMIVIGMMSINLKIEKMETTKRTTPQVAITNRTRKIRAIIKEIDKSTARIITGFATVIKHMNRAKKFKKGINNEEGC